MKKSTTTYFSSVSSAAQLLRHLYPVQAMLHVGAGDGHAAVKKWQEWDIPQVVCIEADPEYTESLQDAVARHDGWLAVSALIGEQEVQAEYYQASNPWESGIVPPEQWERIWPNLSITDSVALQQHRLDALLTEPPYKTVAESINWADLDCMPALPIIKGAGETIGQWDVVRVRVILDDSLAGVSDACLSEIISYLAPHGFSCVAVTESHHPAVGEALFVRDWKNVLQVALVELQAEQDVERKRVHSQLNQLTRSLDEQAGLAEERQGQLDQAVQARTEQDKQLAEVRDQLKDLQDTTAEKEAQIQNLSNQLAENKKMLAEQAGLAEERQGQLDQAVQALAGRNKELDTIRGELAAQNKSIVSLKEQIAGLNEQLAENKKTLTDQSRLAEKRQDQLEARKNSLTGLEEQVEALNEERAESKKTFGEQAGQADSYRTQLEHLQSSLQNKDKRIAELEGELTETVHRQRLLDDEMLKAEAQIDLIKDVLLREEGI